MQKTATPKRYVLQRKDYFSLILTLGLLLLTLLQTLYRVYGDEIAGQVFKEVIRLKSEGLYRVSYSSLRLDFVANTLNAKDLSLRADSSWYDAEQKQWRTKNKIYELYVPALEVKGTGIVKAYFSERLDVDFLHLHNPELYIFGIDTLEKKQENNNFQINSAFFVIRDYLERFQVENFSLDNGSIYFDQGKKAVQPYHIKTINLQAERFLVDSTSHVGKPFALKKLAIQLGKNSVKLPSTNYHVKIDSFSADTEQKNASIEGFHFLPKATAKDSLHAVLDVAFSKISLTGVDFEKAYFQKEVSIDSFYLQEPEAALFTPPTGRPAPDSLDGEALFKYIEPYFKRVQLKQIVLHNSSLNLKLDQADLRKQFQFRKINLHLENFLLDSSTQISRASRYFIDHIEGEAYEYSVLLPDSLHRLSADTLLFSTKEKNIVVKNLKIKPSSSARLGQRDRYHFNLRSFAMNGLDFWEFQQNQNLIFSSLHLEQPQIRWQQYDEPNPLHEREIRLDNLYPLFSRAAKRLYAGEVLVSKADFTREDYTQKNGNTKIRNANIRISRIKLNNNRDLAIRQFLTEGRFQLSIGKMTQEIRQNTHDLSAEGLQFDSRHGDLILNTLEIAAKDELPEKSKLSLVANNLKINDLKLDSLYFDRAFILSKLSLQKANLRIANQEKGNGKIIRLLKTWTDTLTQLKIDTFRVNQLHFYLHKNTHTKIKSSNLSLTVAKIAMDAATRKRKGLPFAFKEVLLSLEDQKIQLLNHELRFKAFFLDSKVQRLRLYDVSLLPLSSQKDFRLQLSLPLIELESKNFPDFLFSTSPSLKNIFLIHPEIIIDLQKEKQESKAKSEDWFAWEKKLKQLVLSEVKRLNTQQLAINDASLKVRIWDETESLTDSLQVSCLTATFNAIHLDASTLKQKKNTLLFAEHFEAQGNAFYYARQDSSLGFRASELYINTKNGGVFSKNIDIKVKDKQKVKLWGHLPKLTSSGFQLRALAQKKLVFDTLRLHKPQFEFELQAAKSKQKPIPARAKQLFQQAFDKITFNKLSLKDGDFSLKANQKQHLKNQEISLLVEQMDFPAAHEKLFWAENWAWEFPTFQRWIGKKQTQSYLLHLENFGGSTGTQSLWTGNYRIHTGLGPQDYSRLLKEEKDWLSLHGDSIRLEKADFKAFFLDNAYRVGFMQLWQPQLRTYRDKRLPEGEKHYVPLPQERLLTANTTLQIDSISILDGKIEYEERVGIYPIPGKFWADSLTLRMNGLRNDSLADRMTLKATGRLMSKIPVYLQFRSSLWGKGRKTYSLLGSLGKGDLRDFNPLLMPLAGIEIKSGKLNSTEFTFFANHREGRGKMKMLYQGLTIKVLDQKDNKEDFGESLKSFLANVFVLRNNNLRLLLTKQGDMFTYRDTTKSIFNHWAKAFIHGAKTSVGLKNKHLIRENRENLRRLRFLKRHRRKKKPEKKK